MYNFFITKENFLAEKAYISGNDFNHIKNVLRLKQGDEFLVSVDGISHLCQLESFEEQTVVAIVKTLNFQDTSLPVDITIFQGLPKSDKMELIIQKAVELGVNKIVPVQMERSIVKLDLNKKNSKIERWQAIAESASKQSKRVCIPEVSTVQSYDSVMTAVKEYDLFLVPYENALGMKATKDCLNKIKKGMKIGVLIGPEGGFSQKEIDCAIDKGAFSISLGKRILRAETASIACLSMLMLHAEMNIE